MTILADATALILLGKISILSTFAGRNDVTTSQIVYEEVVKGKERGRADSFLVENLVYEGRIKIAIPNPEVKKNIERLFNLKRGELEIISLAYKTKNTILSDDKKCINAAKALGLDFIVSLDVVIALWKNKAVSKEKAIACIEKLDEFGWYSKEIIRTYMEELT